MFTDSHRVQVDYSSLAKSLLKIFNFINIFIFLTFLLGVGAILFGFLLLIDSGASTKISNLSASEQGSQVNEPFFVESTSSGEQNKKMIWIDVSGAVQSPGIYQLPERSRVANAIDKAGGFSQDAEALYISTEINLAKTLQDEDKVHVYFEGEREVKSSSNSETLDSNVSLFNAGDGQNSLVSINFASSSRLQELKGVGEKRAADIIANRPYSQLIELVDRKIISESVFEQNENLLTLN